MQDLRREFPLETTRLKILTIMKKLLKNIGTISTSIFAVYTLIVLGCKFYYDRPSILPVVGGGKIDDWAYNLQNYQYNYTPPPELFSLQSLSEHWFAYLIYGLLAAFGVTVLIAITVTATRRLAENSAKNFALLRQDDDLAKKQGLTSILVSLPNWIFLFAILGGIVAIVLNSTRSYHYLNWLNPLFAIYFLLLAICYLITNGYLFISALLHLGSEQAEIRKLGRKKFLLSIILALPSLLFIMAVLSLATSGDQGLVNFLGGIFRWLDGGFGALIMIGAFLLAIISATAWACTEGENRSLWKAICCASIVLCVSIFVLRVRSPSCFFPM